MLGEVADGDEDEVCEMAMPLAMAWPLLLLELLLPLALRLGWESFRMLPRRVDKGQESRRALMLPLLAVAEAGRRPLFLTSRLYRQVYP